MFHPALARSRHPGYPKKYPELDINAYIFLQPFRISVFPPARASGALGIRSPKSPMTPAGNLYLRFAN
jgi:hypothetical protein